MFNLAARPPFGEVDPPVLLRDAPAMVRRIAPGVVRALAARGRPPLASIDRVYVTARAEWVLAHDP